MSQETVVKETETSTQMDAITQAIIDSNKKSEPVPVEAPETKAPVSTEAKQDIAPVETEKTEEVKPKSGGLASKVFTSSKPKEEPPVKPEEKQVTPEEIPEDKIEISEKASAPVREQFKTLKTITKQLRESEAKLRSEANELRVKLEANSKLAPIAMEEVDKLKSEHKAAMDRIALIDIKSHPSFQRDFVQPKKKLIEAANELIVANGLQGVNLESLLSLPRNELGKAIAGITDQLPRFDASEIESNLRDAYKIAAAEREALSKAGETTQELKKRQLERAASEFNATFGELAPRITEFSPEWDVDPSADESVKQRAEKYNSSLKGLKQKAAQYAFAASDERTASAIGIKAAALDHVYEQLLPNLAVEVETKDRELAALRAELASIRKHNPNRASMTSSQESESVTNIRDMNIEDAVKAVFKK